MSKPRFIGRACMTACILVVTLLLVGCATTERLQKARTLKELSIHDSAAQVSEAQNGMAILEMGGTITNTSQKHSIEVDEYPRLQMDGVALPTSYESLDGADPAHLEPGQSVTYRIVCEIDPFAHHDWRFVNHEETVVAGLDEYVRIKEALRAYEISKTETAETAVPSEEEVLQEDFESNEQDVSEEDVAPEEELSDEGGEEGQGA